MPKVNLSASYGYRDPITRERKYYGPGQGIDVPQGLVDTLGLNVIDEATLKGANAEPKAPYGQAEVQTHEPPADPLPDDFPGRKYLVQAGQATLGQVRALSIDNLIEIKGIGTRLAEQILERVKEDA